MDGRLKAALTTYLIERGVKPRSLGNIVSVDAEAWHSHNGQHEQCDVEPEITIYYDEWTEDVSHSYLTAHTVNEDDFESFLTHIANYRQES